MEFEVQVFRRFAQYLILVLPIAVVVSGCRGGKKIAHVHGTVHFKDGTVPQGEVSVVIFTPADSSTAEVHKGASGAINPDGTFDMVTRKPGDGVYVGTYNVSFRILRNTAEPDSSMVEAKYANPRLSGITETIDGDRSDLQYVLEPAAGAAGKTATSGGPGTREGPGT